MTAKRVTKAYLARTARPGGRRRARSYFVSIDTVVLLLMALQASDWPPHFLGAWIILKSELKLPDSLAHAIVLKAICAADVAASPLRPDKKGLKNKKVKILVEKYVGQLANIWSEAGLVPSRADSNLNAAFRSKFRSKFRRFAELILVAITAPWPLQHQLRESPSNFQPWKTIQNPDYQWIVRDEYVRKVLCQTGDIRKC